LASAPAEASSAIARPDVDRQSSAASALAVRIKRFMVISLDRLAATAGMSVQRAKARRRAVPIPIPQLMNGRRDAARPGTDEDQTRKGGPRGCAIRKRCPAAMRSGSGKAGAEMISSENATETEWNDCSVLASAPKEQCPDDHDR